MWQSRWRWYRVVPVSLSSFMKANAPAEKSVSAALHSSVALAVAETNSTSIYENLAAEEALIRGLTLDKDQCLLLYYVNQPCVVVGRNQNIFQEVALRRAARDGVDVARRASGGGAVFHDLHNLCFSFLTHRTRYAPERTIQVVRLGLCALYGIDPARITTTSRYDLFLDGKKITGSAMRVQRDIAYHHCTLLVNTPHALLGRYLHPEGDYAAFKTSSVGSVRSPVTTLTESGCVPPTPDVMDTMKAGMTDFFFSQGSRVLTAEAPWELDLTSIQRAFDQTRPTHAAKVLHRLDVCGAVREDIPLLEGEGRRYARGDATTLGEAVRKARSLEWAYAMPTFTSTVELTRDEFQRGLRSLSAWPDVVQLSPLSERELLAELAEMLFNSSDESKGAEALRLHTTVDHRTITGVALAYVSANGASSSPGNQAETPVEWLGRYFAALLVGSPCDAPVKGLEAFGDASVVVRGFLHEAGSVAPDLPDEARDAAVLLTVKVLLTIWREKNVFDLNRRSSA